MLYFFQCPKPMGRGERRSLRLRPAFLCDCYNASPWRLMLIGVWRPLYSVIHHKWLLPLSPLSLWAKARWLHPGDGSSPTCCLWSSLATAEAYLLADTALCLAPGPLHHLLVCWWGVAASHMCHWRPSAGTTLARQGISGSRSSAPWNCK